MDGVSQKLTTGAKVADIGCGVGFSTILMAQAYPNSRFVGFDLVTMYDCLHDMGDPRGCAGHMRKIMKKDGTWMIVEPIAGDRPEQNMNPVGRLYYNASTMICVPTSLDQEVGEGLGAQAGQAKLSAIITDSGFSKVRRATEGPFNMVLEGRL